MTVSKFAREKIKPLVLEMDEKCEIQPSIIKDMFDNGVSSAVNTL